MSDKSYKFMPLWGILAALFGLLTLVEGGAVLRLSPELRPEGVIPWILAYNFCAGFFYIAAGLGIAFRKIWSKPLSTVIAIANIVFLIALALHVLMGGDFMARTIVAMSLRTAVWVALALYLRKVFK